MEPRFVFSVSFRLQPTGGVWVEPDTFETRLFRPADPPGEPGWLFFRDNLWRGNLADPDHFRDLVDEVLSVDVVDVEYRAFETDADTLEALETEIGASLDEFKAESVSEVLHKYFGSSIEVR
jgi:hypothetical protein